MFVPHSVKYALLSVTYVAEMAAAIFILFPFEWRCFPDIAGIINVRVLSQILFWVHRCLLAVMVCQKYGYLFLT